MDYSNKTFSPQAASDIKEQVAHADIPRKLSGEEIIERKMATAMSPKAARADSQNKEKHTRKEWLEAYVDAIIAEEEKRGALATYEDYPKIK